MNHKREIIEDVALFLFFVFVIITASHRLSSSFILPKEFVLRCFIVIFLIIRVFGDFHLIDYKVTALLCSLALWYVLTTCLALDISISIHGNYCKNDGLINNLIYLLLFYLVVTMRWDKKRIERVFLLFLLSLLPLAIISVCQRHGIDPVFHRAANRPFGTMGNPEPVGAILGVSMLILIYFISNYGWKWKIGLIFVAIMYIVVIYYTFCWTVFMALPACLFMVRRKVILYGLPFVCLACFAIYLVNAKKIQTAFSLHPQHSIGVRILFYENALKIIKDNPFFGVGFDNYRTAYILYRTQRHYKTFNETPSNLVIPDKTHSGYLNRAVTTGIFGSVLFYSFVVYILLRSRGSPFFSLFLSITAFVLIQDVFGWSWRSVNIAPFLYVFLGMIGGNRILRLPP